MPAGERQPQTFIITTKSAGKHPRKLPMTMGQAIRRGGNPVDTAQVLSAIEGIQALNVPFKAKLQR